MKFKRIILSILTISVLFLITGCSKKEYTVKFDTDGGSTIADAVVKKNETVTKPMDPEKEGYKFLHWELDGEEYDFSTKIKKSLTLVAVYRNISDEALTVTFNPNNGTTSTKTLVEENDLVRKPTNPTREGYKFLYWELDGKEFDFTTEITKDIILVAKWERETDSTTTTSKKVVSTEKFTVKFDSAGGTSIPNQTVNFDSTATKPADPTRDGYKFLGWYRNDEIWSFSWKIQKDITLTARWEKIVVADKYTYTTEPLCEQCVNTLVKVYKNGQNITEQAAAVYDASGGYLGRWAAEYSAISISNSDVNKIATIKLNGQSFNLTR